MNAHSLIDDTIDKSREIGDITAMEQTHDLLSPADKELMPLVEINQTQISVDYIHQTYTTETDGFKVIRRQNLEQMSTQSLENVSNSSECEKLPKVQTYQIHGRLRHFVPKLNKTHRVCELMTRILRGKPTELSDFELEPFEITLLSNLLMRKYNNSNIEDDIIIDTSFNEFTTFIHEKKLRYSIDLLATEDTTHQIQTLKKLVDFIKSLKLTKRVEENNKFIYKHTTSYLLTRYVFDNNLKFNTATENLYYDFYFRDHAATIGLNVADFCDPLKTSLIGTNKAKSLNTDYFLKILGCEKFRIEFFKYLSDGFEDHYLSATYKKLERMLVVLEEAWKQSGPEDHNEVLNNFIKKRINHRWCKIPWSKSEVSSAINHFLRYFNELLSRTSINSRKNLVKIYKNLTSQISTKNIDANDVDVIRETINEKKRTSIDIQPIGVIINYKRVKKHSLSLFEPSEFSYRESFEPKK